MVEGVAPRRPAKRKSQISQIVRRFTQRASGIPVANTAAISASRRAGLVALVNNSGHKSCRKEAQDAQEEDAQRNRRKANDRRPNAIASPLPVAPAIISRRSFRLVPANRRINSLTSRLAAAESGAARIVPAPHPGPLRRSGPPGGRTGDPSPRRACPTPPASLPPVSRGACYQQAVGCDCSCRPPHK